MLKINKTAPVGQFRVIGKDNPKDDGWHRGDYLTKAKAKRATSARGSFVRFQVFNDKGECVHGSPFKL